MISMRQHLLFSHSLEQLRQHLLLQQCQVKVMLLLLLMSRQTPTTA